MKTRTVIAGIAGTAAAGAIAARAMRSGAEEETGAEQRMNQLRRHLIDMIAFDNHVLGAVRRQLGNRHVEGMAEAREILEEVERSLEAQVVRLNEELDALGGDGGSPLKAAVTGITGAITGIADRFRSEPVSRMLRDDYVALSAAAISYSMLHTTALTLGSQTLADAAQLCMEQTTPLVVRISDAIPRIVTMELQRESVPMQPDVAEQAEQAAMGAWEQGAQQEHQGS